MKRKLIFLLTIVLVIAGMGVPAVVAQAQSDTPVREIFWLYVPLEVEPGRTWIDTTGGYHVRDQREFGGLKGEVSGNTSLTYNADLDPVTGNGLAYGTITISVLGQVQWEGTWTQLIEGFQVVDGTLSAEGQGSFTGLSLIAHSCVQIDSRYYDRALSYLEFYGYIQPTTAVRIN